MKVLAVDKASCTKCSICAQSCPISIIEMGVEDKYPFIIIDNECRCMYCGHCEAVCPEGALVHKGSEKTALQIVEGNTAVGVKELTAHFKNRRSIRSYLPKTANQATFEQLFDIVRYAPTGTNRQRNQWIVVSNAKLIEELTAGTIQWMRVVSRANPEMAQRLNMSALIASHEKGYDRICRKAPHIVIAYADAKHPIGAKDVVIAAAHLELALPSFGLGGCWAGYLMVALQHSPDLKKLIGLDDSSTVHAALMLGYPKYQYHKTPNRNQADVRWL